MDSYHRGAFFKRDGVDSYSSREPFDNPWVQRIDETAPIYYVKEDVNFSHILLMCYEQDLPSRVEQNQLLVSTIKNFNKETDVELKVLRGYHCRGSSELDEDGEYETIKVIKEWAKRL